MRRCIVFILAFLSACACAQQPFYTATNLGSFYAEGMNDKGEVVGASYNSQLVLYSNGSLQTLGAPPGDVSACGFSINDNDQIVGLSAPYAVGVGGAMPHMFIYSGGQWTVYGVPSTGYGGLTYFAPPALISPSGIIAVNLEAQSNSGLPLLPPVVYNNGTPTLLSALIPNASYISVKAFDPNGMLYGISTNGSTTPYFTYGPSGVSYLPPPPVPNGSYTFPPNALGQIAGTQGFTSEAAQGLITNLQDGAATVNIGTPGGSDNPSLSAVFYPSCIDSAGEVFGLYNSYQNILSLAFTFGLAGSNGVPYVYRDGKYFNLNDLVDMPGLVITNIVGANPSGQVLVQGLIATVQPDQSSSNNGVYFQYLSGYSTYLLTPAAQATYGIATMPSPATGGTVTGSGAYAPGTSVTLTGSPLPGFQFLDWADHGAVLTTSTSLTLTPTSDRTITAEFGPVGVGLSIAPSPDTGGTAAVGTVTFATPTATAFVLNLTSSNSPVASVPQQVSVPQGASSVTFPITTTPVASDTELTLRAVSSSTGIRLASPFVVRAPRVTYLGHLGSPTGGTNASFYVDIDGPAPTGGMPISISSSDPSVNASVGTITVPAGQTSFAFTLPTNPVSTATQVSMTASTPNSVHHTIITIQP